MTQEPCLVLMNTWKAGRNAVYTRSRPFGKNLHVGDMSHVWPQNWLKCSVLKMTDFKVKSSSFHGSVTLNHKSGTQWCLH